MNKLLIKLGQRRFTSAKGRMDADGQVHVARPMNYTLLNADKEAKRMADEFVSTEHLFLAILKVDSLASKFCESIVLTMKPY